MSDRKFKVQVFLLKDDEVKETFFHNKEEAENYAKECKLAYGANQLTPVHIDVVPV